MSAKRRRDTLERFSIPLEEDETPLPPTRKSGIPKRMPLQNITGDYGDDNFSNPTDDDDDDFLDNEEDTGPFSSKSLRGKTKKGKGKAKANIISRATLRAGFDGSSFTGENPKVMLISLKAGALGLNLTVANNVYL